MKRDLDLVRSILLEIENHDSALPNQDFRIEGYSPEEVTYNALLLHEAGYIKGIISKSQYGNSIYPSQLTWKGHEFLDEARDKTVWKKAKEVANKSGSTSLSIFKTILTRVAASQVDQAFTALIS